MIKPVAITLKFAPGDFYVEARIVTLTRRLIRRMNSEWWSHESLLPRFDPDPIDRHWDWNDVSIERQGIRLSSHKVAVVTADGAVQGAMLISTDPYPSGLEDSAQALFVELLFTAPWNRPNLRVDGIELFKGIGLKLLTWGAEFSRQRGYGGRLRLDGSPDFIDWYRRRGFLNLDEEPVVHEDVVHTPMELPPDAARRLLNPRTEAQ